MEGSSESYARYRMEWKARFGDWDLNRLLVTDTLAPELAQYRCIFFDKLQCRLQVMLHRAPCTLRVPGANRQINLAMLLQIFAQICYQVDEPLPSFPKHATDN